jgi:hypothetical protein
LVSFGKLGATILLEYSSKTVALHESFQSSQN